MTPRRTRDFHLNLWEWADQFGEGVWVGFKEFAGYVSRRGCQTYKRKDGSDGGLRYSTAGNRWDRFRKDVQQSPFVVDFEGKRGAMRFLRGTAATLQEILDNQARERDLAAFYKVVGNDTRRWQRQAAQGRQNPRPRIPSWIYAAAHLGVHLEVPCPNEGCRTPEGLYCNDKRGKAVFHLNRVYAAMAARDQLNDEEEG